MKTAAEYFTERYGHSYNGPMDSIEAIKFATAYADEITEPQASKEFPTWQEAVDGITDSRFTEMVDMNVVRSGGRIMYDRLYSMLHKQNQK